VEYDSVLELKVLVQEGGIGEGRRRKIMLSISSHMSLAMSRMSGS
jgi:hypothetical protein